MQQAWPLPPVLRVWWLQRGTPLQPAREQLLPLPAPQGPLGPAWGIGGSACAHAPPAPQPPMQQLLQQKLPGSCQGCQAPPAWALRAALVLECQAASLRARLADPLWAATPTSVPCHRQGPCRPRHHPPCRPSHLRALRPPHPPRRRKLLPRRLRARECSEMRPGGNRQRPLRRGGASCWGGRRCGRRGGRLKMRGLPGWRGSTR